MSAKVLHVRATDGSTAEYRIDDGEPGTNVIIIRHAGTKVILPLRYVHTVEIREVARDRAVS